jgi:hypothetical protein
MYSNIDARIPLDKATKESVRKERNFGTFSAINYDQEKKPCCRRSAFDNLEAERTCAICGEKCSVFIDGKWVEINEHIARKSKRGGRGTPYPSCNKIVH